MRVLLGLGLSAANFQIGHTSFMTLNKDLFGKIPVTPVSSTPVKMSPPPKHGFEGETMYHGSEKDPSEFMKAPIIHVGTAEQAASAVDVEWNDHWNHEFDEPEYEYAENVPGVHALQLSKHAKVHRITVPDDIANEANVHFLRERGYPISPSVNTTRSFHGVEHPLVKSALNALRQNKVVPYINNFETPQWLYDEDTSDPETERAVREASKSFMVPSPSLNMAQFGKKDPQGQPMFPMDYTGVLPESKTTKLKKSK